MSQRRSLAVWCTAASIALLSASAPARSADADEDSDRNGLDALDSVHDRLGLAHRGDIVKLPQPLKVADNR